MDRKSTPESLKVFRNDKKMDGSPSATNIDILDKYESAIRSEFGGMTTDVREIGQWGFKNTKLDQISEYNQKFVLRSMNIERRG